MKTMILPTKKSEKNLNWTSQKFLCIGPGGIGKSEFWAQGERTLFVECEPGLNFLEVQKVPIRSWEDFIDLGSALTIAAGKGEFPYDTVVIDTVDKWIDRANEDVIVRARTKYKTDIDSIGDVPNGNGWFLATDQITTYLDKLTQFPAAIVLIAHTESKKIKQGAVEFDKTSIAIGGKTGKELLHWADHTLHIQAIQQGQNMRRIVRTKPTQTLEAKSRGGTVPDGWEWSDDMAANYKKLRSIFLP